jgi:hypothetical protein
MSDTASWPRRESERVVAMLVSQALDDIEAENIDVATAFRLVAERAWTEGHRAGLTAGGFPEPPTGHPTERYESRRLEAMIVRQLRD